MNWKINKVYHRLILSNKLKKYNKYLYKIKWTTYPKPSNQLICINASIYKAGWYSKIFIMLNIFI